jgi:UDP-N-acetylmuramyl pentapeptide synthase
MLRGILSLFSPQYPKVITYMLQNTEYKAGAYIRWYWRTQNFNTVMKRRQLDPTRAARVLLLFLTAGMLLQIVIGVGLVVLGLHDTASGAIQFGLALLVSYPIVWGHLIVLPLVAGNWLLIKPTQARKIRSSRKVFEQHSATIIAIAGSYGKTTMKELLLTVLSEGKKVAATPANKNVAISHAQFANKLSGDEEILIVEYGEGAPGDIKRFVKNTKPTMAVITGLAPAHLDRYKTLKRAGKDIFSVASYLHHKNVFVAGESEATKPFIQPGDTVYTSKKVLGWSINAIEVRPDGVHFEMKKGSNTLRISSGLLGRHQVAPLALVAALADQLGLTKKQIESGMQKTQAYEHRMQSRQLGGGWILDDTYNGNIDGIRAGLKLLKELPARKKIYVTPGLVDQGKQTKNIHIEIGKLIADAAPDEVILMNNSVTKYIQKGLVTAGYFGTVTVETDPLFFYSNIEHFIAKDVIVLMQNDWTDNYA